MWDAGECDARRYDVGFRELAAARAEPREHIAGRRHALPGRSREDAGQGGADGQRQARRTGKPQRGPSRAIVAGTDREDGLRMREQEGIHDRIDHGAALMLVADPETHVEHER